ncbi:MAG: hypothetical protein B5M53_01250 [Candidatus Cloacimonas sp. 4484_209]|nr:MAG: hypothetical protein B5M53_01250 [Candidatus Cloacimonas sp. 4484_209]
MFLPLVFITLLISQDSLTANMQYYPVLKMVPEYEESPFRGEPYIFEVTQPFIKLDERSLLSLNVTNKRSLPLPPNFTFWSFIRNIPFRETAGFPPYLVKNLYITLKPPAVSMLDRHKFPVWVSLKDFIGNIPFSQIRLFKKKSESENMQFTFGRNISDFGRFNIAADYIDSTQKTKRSMVLSSNIKLPFNTSSHFIFLDISNDFSYYSFEDKYLFFSVDRKEGNIGIVKKTAGGKDLLGITSNMFFHMPYQRFTIGFDYPDLLSSFYQFIFVDQINLFPLSYIVPRFAIDADRHYTVSLGTGYHPLLNLYVYSNIQKESDKTLYYSFGLRKRMRKAYLEGFVYSQGQEERKTNPWYILCTLISKK